MFRCVMVAKVGIVVTKRGKFCFFYNGKLIDDAPN